MTAIGVPIKVLHEAEGHVITLETTIGISNIKYGLRRASSIRDQLLHDYFHFKFNFCYLWKNVMYLALPGHSLKKRKFICDVIQLVNPNFMLFKNFKWFWSRELIWSWIGCCWLRVVIAKKKWYLSIISYTKFWRRWKIKKEPLENLNFVRRGG